jgi:hypothetical protein
LIALILLTREGWCAEFYDKIRNFSSKMFGKLSARLLIILVKQFDGSDEKELYTVESLRLLSYVRPPSSLIIAAIRSSSFSGGWKDSGFIRVIFATGDARAGAYAKARDKSIRTDCLGIWEICPRNARKDAKGDHFFFRVFSRISRE